MSITINNQQFEANRIGSYRPSEALATAQSKLGAVILDHCSKSQYDSAIRALQKDNSAIQKLRAKNAHNAAYFILTKNPNLNIHALIIYASPSADSNIGNVVRLALDNNVKVFQRTSSKKYIEYIAYKACYEEACGRRYFSFHQYLTADNVVTNEQLIANNHDLKPLSQAEKDSLSYELKYYDLDYPHSEAEWSLAKETIAFYKKNNIPYAFDTNQFYICPDCKHLARIDTPHECFNETHEYNKLDYIVNGGE